METAELYGNASADGLGPLAAVHVTVVYSVLLARRLSAALLQHKPYDFSCAPLTSQSLPRAAFPRSHTVGVSREAPVSAVNASIALFHEAKSGEVRLSSNAPVSDSILPT